MARAPQFKVTNSAIKEARSKRLGHAYRLEKKKKDWRSVYGTERARCFIKETLKKWEPRGGEGWSRLREKGKRREKRTSVGSTLARQSSSYFPIRGWHSLISHTITLVRRPLWALTDTRGESNAFLLHRAAATLLRPDRFTATLGTDLLEVTYEVVAVRMDRVATPKYVPRTMSLRHMFVWSCVMCKLAFMKCGAINPLHERRSWFWWMFCFNRIRVKTVHEMTINCP